MYLYGFTPYRMKKLIIASTSTYIKGTYLGYLQQELEILFKDAKRFYLYPMQDLEALAMKITPKWPPKLSKHLVKICAGYTPLKTLFTGCRTTHKESSLAAETLFYWSSSYMTISFLPPSEKLLLTPPHILAQVPVVIFAVSPCKTPMTCLLCIPPSFDTLGVIAF